MGRTVLVSDKGISVDVDTAGYRISGFPSEQAAHLFISLGHVVPPPDDDPYYRYFEEPVTLTIQLEEDIAA